MRLSTPPSDSASAKILTRLDEPAGPRLRRRVEGDHPAESVHLPLGELVLRMRREAGIVEPRSLRPLLEPLRDPAAVGVVLPHPERKGLGAAEASQQSIGPGTAPAAFWIKPSRSATSRAT